MRILLLLIFALIVTIPSALGLVLSEDGTGLKHTFIVQTGGYDFPVEATGNLDVTDLSFDKDTKTITLDTVSYTHLTLPTILLV